jgi:hypothetical protein
MSINVPSNRSKDLAVAAKLIVMIGEFDSFDALRTAVHANANLTAEEKQFALSLVYSAADFAVNGD